MKKKFMFAIVMMILISLVSISVNAAASKKLYEDMSLKTLINMPDKDTYVFKINALDKEIKNFEVDELKDQIDYYSTQMEGLTDNNPQYYEYKLQILSLEKDLSNAEFEAKYFEDKDDVDKKILQFNLQSKYYDLYLLDTKIKFANAESDYLKKVMEIERLKLSQERTTENAVLLSEIDVQISENSINQTKNEKNQTERMIANMLNQYKTDSYSFHLELPTDTPSFTKSEKTVAKNFFDKNFDINRRKTQIEADESYFEVIENIYGEDSDICKKLNNSIERSKLELEIKEEDYKLYISEKFLAYNMALEDKRTHDMYRQALTDKQSILQSSLTDGQISTIDFMYQQTEINSALYNCAYSDVALIMTAKELELIDEGII